MNLIQMLNDALLKRFGKSAADITVMTKDFMEFGEMLDKDMRKLAEYDLNSGNLFKLIEFESEVRRLHRKYVIGSGMKR